MTRVRKCGQTISPSDNISSKLSLNFAGTPSAAPIKKIISVIPLSLIERKDSANALEEKILPRSSNSILWDREGNDFDDSMPFKNLIHLELSYSKTSIGNTLINLPIFSDLNFYYCMIYCFFKKFS